MGVSTVVQACALHLEVQLQAWCSHRLSPDDRHWRSSLYQTDKGAV